MFSTIPPGGIDAGRNGLFVRATTDVVFVAFRDSVAVVAPRAAVESGACSTLHVWADVGGVGADFVGIPGATGTRPPRRSLRSRACSPICRCRPAGPVGPHRRRHPVHHLADRAQDRADGARRAWPRWPRSSRWRCWIDGRVDGYTGAWRRFWRAGVATWLTDGVVIGTLLLWHVIGATTSDDGYNTTIARVSGEAGYVTNYYRYFGASEAPFDWYQSVLAHLASISTAGVWLRVPATLAAIGTWLLLSRCVLPRLGRRLNRNRVAVLTAGAVFIAAWLPFNNGLRPEPLIAFGVVAVWVLMESAIGTRRLWPTALAIVVAVFCVTLAPQGLVAVAPLLIGARAVTRIIAARRAKTDCRPSWPRSPPRRR